MAVFIPETVKRRARLCICFLTGIILTVGAGASGADESGVPYREIASRNSFGLKAQPEMPKSPPAVPPLPRIRLAGITTILGRKLAFLVVTASEPGGLPECLVLAEGQRQRDVEAAEIDVKPGTVRVRRHGREETLILGLTDGDASPGVNPQVFFCPGAPSGINQFSSGADPLGGGTSSPMNAGIAEQNQATAGLTPEQIDTIIEAQRMKAIQDGDPIAKILPPTDFTPEIMANY